MATLDQTREAQRRRKANQRARDKGLPEPYGAPTAADKELIGQRETFHIEDLAFAQELDASGSFYKSECRAAIKLLAIFEGNNHVGEEDEDNIDTKTGKKKVNIPNPSITAIRIRATEVLGLPVSPRDKNHRNTMEVNGVIRFREWLDLRDKARKDLFWLGRLLGNDFFHDTHQQMCDMFVKKQFDGLYFPGFNRTDVHEMIAEQKRFDANGKPTRTMMLFAPRSSFKSTIDGVDAIQWLLNAPDIRILIMTSTLRLSKELMAEVKKHLYLAPRAEASAFQLLFPEYILTGIAGRSREPIVCPAANFVSREPHVWVTSLDSSFVGSRCDIRKIDDAVEDKNSATDELRDSLKEKIKSTGALVESWGFTDVIGTRYYTNDWYGWRMGQVPDPEDVTNSTEPFAYLSLSAWKPKPGFEIIYQLLLEKKGGVNDVTEDMVDLFFPYKMPFRVLRTRLNEYKERGFKNQYLNVATDPQEEDDFAVHFTKEVLRAHTYAKAAMPKVGEKIVTLDFSYTSNSNSDWSVLAAVLRHEREDGTQELVVEDIDYDKWKGSELVDHTIWFLRKHNPAITIMERANGSEFFMLALQARARAMGIEHVLNSIRIVDVDNTKNAKATRIKTLEILLADDRLHFVAGTWIDELYRQFERFTGETKKGRKDDIPDSISLASRRLPQSMFRTVVVDPEAAALEEDEDFKRRAKEEHYRKYFGNNSFSGTHSANRSNPPQPTEHPPTWRERATGVRKDAPVQIAEVEPQKPSDPRLIVFGIKNGKKGPWRL
jgi:predicted phage terminase large subunit-like protein